MITSKKETAKEFSARDYLGDNWFTFGLVTKSNLTTIEEIIRFLEEKKITIIYKKVSAGKLWIKEGDSE